ncbi:bifunctional aminoglycoside phosphotransferase/ATP-binding protein [Parafrankia discariae]|uniref:bifunctional aminoglycoside phosphotransferase/ATP-binding protein n=1 Tax=Parafrankia discariae TaxID=365528 RepID=UPI000375EA4C|nr:AAA family ATPase [Parafrankia discariae]
MGAATAADTVLSSAASPARVRTGPGGPPASQCTPAGPPARLVETHTSVLVFLGDRVYKTKKPADLGFLDFRTRQAREAACHAEVDLNRRLAPDVYLGVADVFGPDGSACDHMVVMRRLPAGRRLSTLVTAGGDVTGELRAVARLLADFHSRCATSDQIADAGSATTLRGLWEEGLRGVQPYVGSVLDAGTIEAVGRLAGRYLDGREPLLRERQRRGLIRDGHGDLLADDIYCLDDGPRVLDCLEFDQRLRVGDVLGDIAFLAMDLERLGRSDLAAYFLDRYREYSAETHPRSLEHLYVAYRAFVRCKVACARHEQGDRSAAAQARALASLALVSLRHGRVRLVLVGGARGSGRGELAADLAEAEGWTLLRAETTGAGPGQATSGVSDAGYSDAGYEELLRRARIAAERGETVILDAPWARRGERERAAAIARATAADLVQLRCAHPDHTRPGTRPAPEPRPGTRSDTGHTDELAGADPWPEARTLRHTTETDAILRAARRATG